MKYPIFCGSCWRSGKGWPFAWSGFWFRVCGYGLHVSNKRRSEALFSERNGFRKALYVLGIRLEVLKP